MILVDTSVWRFALRRTAPRPPGERARWEQAQVLPDVLDRGLVVSHSWVFAELLLGGLPPSAAVLYLRLPRSRPVAMSALLELVEHAQPRGLGLVDVGLLGAALRDGHSLWTLDGALFDQAVKSGVAWAPGTR